MDWFFVTQIINVLVNVFNALFVQNNAIGGIVLDAIDGSETTITDLISGEIADLEDLLTDLDIDITGPIEAQTLQLNATQAGQTEALADIIDSALQALGIDATENTEQILDALDDISDQIRRDTESATGEVIGAIQEQSLDTASLIGDLTTLATAGFAEEKGVLDGIWDIMQGGFKIVIDNVAMVEDSVFDTLLTTVGSILSGNTDTITGVIDTLTNKLGGIFSGIIDAMIAKELADKPELLLIVDAILANKPEALELIENVQNPTEAGTGAAVTESVASVVDKKFRLLVNDLKISTAALSQGSMVDSLTMVCDFIGVDSDAHREARIQAYVLEGLSLEDAREAVDINWATQISNAAISVLSLLAWPMAISQKQVQACLAVWSESNPWQVLSPGDAVHMYYRGLLDDAQAKTVIQRNGYGANDAARLIDAGQRIPEVENLLALWLRGSLGDNAIDYGLKQLGFTTDYADGMKELAFFIPPVQDLILMAVREVFSPEIRREQQQDADFPEDFKVWAAKQGVSEDWAKNYWAAHWSLPSPQMGFEMLHRGVITTQQLKDLLRALDVMPGWRDALVDISYSPYTRVDIRRMHALGVLDRNEVLRAYQDIGYNPDRAEKLTAFTEELNQDDDGGILDVASDLTRGSIIRFFKRGTISKTETRALLLQMGLNPLASNLFIANAELENDLRDRQQDLDNILDKYQAELITYAQASTDVQDLNLPHREQTEALITLKRMQDRKNKTPSRSDLDKFLAAGMITDDKYVEVLEQNGYSSYWAEKYLALNVA